MEPEAPVVAPTNGFAGEKPWWQSRSAIGSMVASLVILLNMGGFNVDPVLEGEIADKAHKVVALVGAITAIVGRVFATKRLV